MRSARSVKIFDGFKPVSGDLDSVGNKENSPEDHQWRRAFGNFPNEKRSKESPKELINHN